jgi:hypothetical protein
MKNLHTVLLASFLAFTLACGYSNKGTPPTAGVMPTISALAPPSANHGGADFVMTVNGASFNADAVVNFGGVAMGTTFVTNGQLTATIPAAQIANAGNIAVTVTNPGHSGGGIYGSGGTTAETSGPMTFTIN